MVKFTNRPPQHTHTQTPPSPPTLSPVSSPSGWCDLSIHLSDRFLCTGWRTGGQLLNEATKDPPTHPLAYEKGPGWPLSPSVTPSHLSVIPSDWQPPPNGHTSCSCSHSARNSLMGGKMWTSHFFPHGKWRGGLVLHDPTPPPSNIKFSCFLLCLLEEQECITSGLTTLWVAWNRDTHDPPPPHPHPITRQDTWKGICNKNFHFLPICRGRKLEGNSPSQEWQNHTMTLPPPTAQLHLTKPPWKTLLICSFGGVTLFIRQMRLFQETELLEPVSDPPEKVDHGKSDKKELKYESFPMTASSKFPHYQSIYSPLIPKSGALEISQKPLQ